MTCLQRKAIWWASRSENSAVFFKNRFAGDPVRGDPVRSGTLLSGVQAVVAWAVMMALQNLLSEWYF